MIAASFSLVIEGVTFQDSRFGLLSLLPLFGKLSFNYTITHFICFT